MTTATTTVRAERRNDQLVITIGGQDVAELNPETARRLLYDLFDHLNPNPTN